MSPDERAILLERIDNHHAAMRAQVERPDVPLEFMNNAGEWRAVQEPYGLFNADDNAVEWRSWHRLAPAPKMVDLDQSDFLGPNRVTHVRPKDQRYSEAIALLVFGVRVDGIQTQYGFASYASLALEWECSRDDGATFGPCSKEAV